MPSASLRIAVDDPRHLRIVEAIEARREFSEREHSSKYTAQWEAAEDRFVAYIPESEADARRRDKRKTGDVKFTTIKIPMSYAVLMTAHTYWTSVFLGRNPMFQHVGRHGEADRQVQAVDALIDYQVQVGGHLPAYYVWLLDPAKYSFGVLWSYWVEEKETVSQIVEEESANIRSLLGVGAPTKKKMRVVQEIPGYQGNRIFNVQPWDFMWDPRVSLMGFQQGEYVGRRCRVGWNTVLKREAQGIYFNVEELRRRRRGRSAGEASDTSPGSPRVERPTTADLPQSSERIPETGYIDLIEMVVELSPEEWGIGKSSRPEKWVFTVASSRGRGAGGSSGAMDILIGLSPLGAYHNKFPVSVLTFEPEAYGQVSQSLVNRTDPLNHVLDWLINTHFFNVRAALSNQFIYDPSRLMEIDVLDTTAGKMIRMRPEAYGQDIRQMFMQVPVADVTQSHLNDSQGIWEMIQRVTGVTDNIMGLVNPGGRKTATEVRTSSSFGINRLKTIAEFFSAQGFQPLDMMLVQNTQQYFNAQRKFRIAGDLINSPDPFIDVSPESIQGFFDFVPVDGSMPVDKFALANLWRQMLVDMARVPPLMAGYNLPGIFEHVAQLAGLKSIKQFRVEVQPDVMLAKQAQAGNVVALGGEGGPTRGGAGSPTAAGEGSEGLGRIPQPRQLPGLGQAG
jgi:hypothetical protein